MVPLELGRALADLFAEQEHTLLLVARNKDWLRIAADELERKWQVEVHIAAIDLMEHGSSTRLMQQVKDLGFYVDILINSAALSFLGAFKECDPNDINKLLYANMTSPTELAHLCIAGMSVRGRGGILNIASIAGLLPVPNMAIYSASKSYLISFTRSLAEEMRNYNVKVSVVVPGPIETSFVEVDMDGYGKYVPTLSPKNVAKIAYEGFLSGQTVISPGFLGMFYRLGIKVIPHKILIRIFGPVLKQYYAG